MKIFMLIVLSMFIAGCGTPSSFEHSEIAMGTLITLKADNGNARAAVEESFKQIAQLEENISIDLKKIEAVAGSGEFVKISPDVYQILKISQRYSKLTGGAFDVTCGAAIELWGIGTPKARVPTDEEIATVKNLVGYEHLHLRDGTAYLDKRGMKINLGGVAKGYSVDLARKIFIAHDVTSGLIDFGSSTIYAFGKKKIGIKNPDDPEKIIKVVELENAALSTSGDYEKFFVANGRRYHHIIDPKTCMPIEGTISSTSITVKGNVEDCASIADILSTTAFVTKGIN